MAAALPFVMAGVQVMGELSSANQQSGQANYQAQIAGQNATAAQQQANAKEELIRRENAQRLGTQRAQAAQSGFDPSSGSLLKIQGDSAANAELDALTARYEGQMQGLSYNNQAAGFRSQASNAKTTGMFNAAGALLSARASYGKSQSLKLN